MVSATSASIVTPASATRLRSIDVFRGATIAAMILVNGQYSSEASYRQLAHAAWHGLTFADTIFPCFLFLVGVSLTLSTASRTRHGEGRRQLIWHAATRALLLLACGVAVDELRFPSRAFPFVGLQDHLQLSGALQKIAVCYLVAFMIHVWTGVRGVVAAIVAFSALSLAFLYMYPVPGCGAGALEVSCNFPAYLDAMVLGRFRWNSPAFDPDGVASVLPAVISVLFGVLAGETLPTRVAPRAQASRLLVGGLLLMLSGAVMSRWVPLNKQLWTVSFAVLTAGLSAVGLALCIWLVDGRRAARWYRPLEILGQNAVAAYLISRVVVNLPRVHVMGSSLHDDVLARVTRPADASLLYALLILALVYLAVSVMDRRGWHLKL